jgi:hypothetical protein
MFVKRFDAVYHPTRISPCLVLGALCAEARPIGYRLLAIGYSGSAINRTTHHQAGGRSKTICAGI